MATLPIRRFNPNAPRLNIPFTAKDIKLIKIFKSSYNARYLRDLEGLVVVKEAKIYRLYNMLLKKGKHPVLLRLIRNLINYHMKDRPIQFIKPPYNFRNIEGPHFLKKLRLKQYGKEEEEPLIKTAYIYGEFHSEKDEVDNSCPKPNIRFNKYLNLLKVMSPAFTDVYLEEGLGLQTNQPAILDAYKNIITKIRTGVTDIDLFEEFDNSSRLLSASKVRANSFIFTEIRKELNNCIAPQYDNKECAVIRLHNIDMRATLLSLSVDYATVLICLHNIFVDNNIFENPRKKIIGVSNLIKVIKDNFETDAKNLLTELIHIMKTNPTGLIEAFKDNETIKKEYGKSYERENIDAFFIQICSLDSARIISGGNILEKVLNAHDKSSLPTTSEINQLDILLGDISVMIMDYYGLLRIFKDYIPREKKLPTDPEPLDHPIRSSNIIIYAGAFHSERYCEFFQSIGFETFFSYINPIVEPNPRIAIKQSHCVDTKQEYPTVSRRPLKRAKKNSI